MAEPKRCSQCGAELPPDAPGGHCFRCLLQLGLAAGATSPEPTPSSAAALPAEQAGDRIGRYKLLQQIGEGGCGLVYMAEQEEPLRRRVALKIVKLGMDTKQVIARFEAERQALALMDHPNIAKVFDAGVTANGRPYFVMELVRGVKITDYCDRQKFSTRQRLDLFILVCQAVQHAHQKGIIHRDLKPSNVLVTQQDGAAVPKVIDFGIAKATGDLRLTDQTLFTAFEQFIGTPAYMSPEQAGLGGLDIDTRSDIYSLGVLLYELLAGQPPFESSKLQRLALDDLLRTIREKAPTRPSAKLTMLTEAERATVAEQRQTESGKLPGLLRGDLDWIVMKCLEKARGRRYETANGLAADIRRHLNSEPVVARPPSRFYEFQKTVRRHRVGFAATAAVIVSLAIGLVVSTVEAVRARQAEAEQNRLRQKAVAAQAGETKEREKAQTEATKSHDVARLLGEMLQSVGPSVALGRDTKLLREVLDKAAARLGMELTNQPEVEAELRQVIGSTYEELGEYSNALAMARETLRLRRQIFNPTNLAIADAQANIGALLLDLGDFTGAEKADRAALTLRLELLGSENTNIATSYNNLGLALWNQGRFAEAAAAERKALDIRRQVLGNQSLEVGKSLSNLGLVLFVQGDLTGAEPMFREALDLFRKQLSPDHPNVALLLNNLGTAQWRKGDLDGAETSYREAFRIRQKVLGPNHPYIAYSLTQLGLVLTMKGQLEEAEQRVRDALAMEQQPALAGDDSDTSDSLACLGRVLSKKGDFTGADAALNQALALKKKLLGPKSPDIADVLDASALQLAGRGDLENAAIRLRDALAMDRDLQGGEHPNLIPLSLHLAWVLSQQGQTAEADVLRRDAQAIANTQGVYGVQAWSQSQFDLVDILAAAGKFSEGEVTLLETVDFVQRTAPVNVPLRRRGLERAARFYETWQRASPGVEHSIKSAEWRKKLAAFDLNAPEKSVESR